MALALEPGQFAIRVAPKKSSNPQVLFPVVNPGGLAPDFTNEQTLLFMSSDSKVRPICFDVAALAANNQITFEFVYALRQSSSSDGTYSAGASVTVEGRVLSHPWPVGQGEYLSNGVLVGTQSLTTPMKIGDQVTVELPMVIDTGVCALNKSKPVNGRLSPWGVDAKYDFTITITPADADKSQVFTDAGWAGMELYAVGQYIPPYLAYEGIPGDLLRLALLPFSTTGAQQTLVSSKGFPEYAAHLIHSGTGFKYDSVHGSSNFCMGSGDYFGRFELNRYLKNWSTLGLNADHTTAEAKAMLDYNPDAMRVNCFDQSAILWLVLSLSFVSLEDRKAVTSYYMNPYGYITNTDLVGWPESKGKTNSPYFAGKLDKMHVDPTDSKRTRFQNHVFLTWYDMVFDSCAGPHVGNETLATYVSKAIDPDFDSKATFTTKDEKTGAKIDHPWVNGTADPQPKAEGGKPDARGTAPPDKHRGHLRGPERYYDSARYMDEWKESEALTVMNRLIGGFTNLPAFNTALSTAMSAANFTAAGLTAGNVGGPVFETFDHQWTKPEDVAQPDPNQDKVWTATSSAEYYVSGNAEDPGRSWSAKLTMFITNAGDVAAAYMKDDRGKTSHRTPATVLEQILGQPGVSTIITADQHNHQENPIHSAIVRFVMSNIFVKLITKDLTFPQISLLATVVINTMTTISSPAQLELVPNLKVSIGDSFTYQTRQFSESQWSPLQTEQWGVSGTIPLATSQIVRVQVPVTNQTDIDWRYDSGCVFLLREDSDPVNGQSTIELIGRKAGNDVLALNYYDAWYRSDICHLRFTVT